MDSTRNETESNESSLLLKYPINLFSNNLNSDNLLMPVGRQENNADNIEINLKSSEVSDNGESRISPAALCQLEQPLLFRGVSKPSPTNQHVSQSTSLSEPTAPPTSRPLEQPIQDSIYFYPQTNFSVSPAATLEPNDLSNTSLSQPSDFQIGYGNFRSQSSHDLKTNAVKTGPVYPEESFDRIKPYWFFSDFIESKEIWYGFSETDSQKLEEAYQLGSDSLVPTDGGRCDVNLTLRKKKFVYFESKELDVRRCTWFHQQGSSMRFKPYDENTSTCLEDFYHKWITSGAQDMRFVIPGIIGSFLFEKPSVMLHYGVDANTWTAPNEPKGSPKIVKRGLPEGGFQIMPDESPKIDHLLFIVQGIGSFCDLRFRTVAECVDGFRDIANKLIDSHFKKEVEQGAVGRVEILPVAWHAKLRTSDIGLDRTMKMITLPSIPKLRHFTNDTLIDILLYSSPSYCQSIVDTVAQELNNLYDIFLSRNSEFCGKIFVAGHSLGSLIIFDILSSENVTDDNDEIVLPENSENSKTTQQSLESFTDIEHLLKTLNLEEYLETFNNEKIDLIALPFLSDEDLKNIGLPTGPRRKLMNAGYLKEKFTDHDVSPPDTKFNEITDIENKKTYNSHNRVIFPLQKPNNGDSVVMYPRLRFHPAAFFAMGSPISMFLAIRGFDTISEKFSFPTCPAFFHIFHPYDPVAFRIEPMIDHCFMKKPALIPHHKGRKRMHLEIKENVAKFANELRQKVMDTLHKTWHSFNELTGLQPFPQAALVQEVNSVVSQEIPEVTTYDESATQDMPIGNLNGGRRIDYVLQEKPLEALNDYVWALTSHATYWDSDDTVLMILREIYAIQGINVSPHSESFILENTPESFLPVQNYNQFPRDFMENTYPSNLPRNASLPSNITSSINTGVTSNVDPIFEDVNYSFPGSASSNLPSTNANFPTPSVSSNLAPTNANYPISSASSNLAPTNANYPTSSTTSHVASAIANYHAPPSAPSNGVPVNYPAAPPSAPSNGVPVNYPAAPPFDPSMPPSHSFGPPPLTGFVKRSAFSK